MPNGGVLTEIIVEAFKRTGYDVEIKFVPWKRALEGAKTGKYDGIYTLWYRREKEEWFAYSDPVSPASETGFYKRKDKDISFETFEDLKPYTIGVGRGYARPPGFDEASLKISLAKDDEENLRKLHKGRVDLALAELWAIQGEEQRQMILDVAAREHEVDFEAVEAIRGARLEGAADASLRDGVATIPIAGPIYRSANLFTEISGATTIEITAQDLRAAVDGDKANGIALPVIF